MSEMLEIQKYLINSPEANLEAKLEKLNSLVHPAVISQCERLAKVPCVLDAPQLFEAKAQDK